jgi:hypothetical protein
VGVLLSHPIKPSLKVGVLLSPPIKPLIQRLPDSEEIMSRLYVLENMRRGQQNGEPLIIAAWQDSNACGMPNFGIVFPTYLRLIWTSTITKKKSRSIKNTGNTVTPPF